MVPAPWLLALALAIGLLVLIPARRLQLAGVRSRWIGLYALALWSLGMLVAIRPVATRFLVPIILVAYLAPFVAAPEGIRRLLRRPPDGTDPVDRPPMKDVTPPDGGGPP